jgi:putative tryptophan/tyrosine transport system substrate-binding protein
MIHRRTFLAGMAATMAAPLVGEAQPAGHAPRLGYLGVNRPDEVPTLLQALRLGLREHGWVEGRNISIEYRWALGASEHLPRLAEELGRFRVNLLIAPTTQAIDACKRRTSGIPIVMIAANDPVADGFVASLARPGGNITGLVFDPGLEIGAKHVELLVQAVPRLSRIAALGNPENRAHRRMIDAVHRGAQGSGVELVFVEARVPNEVKITDFAAKEHLPAIYPWREAATAGGFITYGANLADNFRRAASFVDRILRGAQPGDLPVERPDRYELVINLKTAKALNLTIPPSLLLRADEVIECRRRLGRNVATAPSAAKPSPS